MSLYQSTYTTKSKGFTLWKEKPLRNPSVSKNSRLSPIKSNSLKNYVVLRRNSSTSSCSTSSSDSDEDLHSEAITTSEMTKFHVYESYAAVATRSLSNRNNLQWKDLNRPRFHVASLLQNIPKDIQYSTRLSQKQRRRKQQLERKSTSMEDSSIALELCFTFLTFKELQTASLVCRGFYNLICMSPHLFLEPYNQEWRGKQISPLPALYWELSYGEYITLCSPRVQEYPLSTRGSVVQKDTTTVVVNDSMLRSFTRGAIDSTRGVNGLSPLPCALALGKSITYYEVTMNGSGSVGLVNIKDEESKSAYGFGSSEHVGWKGIAFGYHGNDGDYVYNDGTVKYGGEWQPFGPSWGVTSSSNDTNEVKSRTTTIIGCGINSHTEEIFFTRNGVYVGAVKISEKVCYPSIRGRIAEEFAVAFSLHDFGDSAILNVGHAPFAYDIEGFCASS